MELEKLQLNLRPRSNRQALDLGFTLLHMDLWNVYMAWLALIVPCGLLVTALVAIWPEHSPWLWLLLWWPLPMFERAPLHVLSRKVFGEEVNWRQAVRAWPQHLRGGMLGMLTLGRFNTARGLYHAVWQLEGARGKAARERKNLLGSSDTSSSAYWYGVLCAYFITVLQFGMIGLISIFIPRADGMVNPFELLLSNGELNEQVLTLVFSYLTYLVALAVVGPVFVACSFTLYLNRRATLEAWDLEIALRQIKPPRKLNPHTKTSAKTTRTTLLVLLASSLFLVTPPTPVHAKSSESKIPAAPANLDKCTPPAFIEEQIKERQPPRDEQQKALRQEMDGIMAAPDVRPYQCVERFSFSNHKPDEARKRPKRDSTIDNLVGASMKVILIAVLAAAVLWLILRYRHHLGGMFGRKPQVQAATEVGGLDIRPESLPPDVAAQVLRLWRAGEQRAALGLLYRATLSRLVQQDELFFSHGATEGDCLAIAAKAQHQLRMSLERLKLVRICTELWRDAAYGERWPHTEVVEMQCVAWQAEFGASKAEVAA